MKSEEMPTIPPELKHRILIESGHRCSVPSCRHIEVNIHHIIPWEKCKNHDYKNLIALCPKCYEKAKNNIFDSKSLLLYKTNIRFAIERFSQFEMDIMFELLELSKSPPDNYLLFPGYLNFLIKRLIDAGMVHISKNDKEVWVGVVKTTPDFLYITEKGMKFMDMLGKKEII